MEKIKPEYIVEQLLSNTALSPDFLEELAATPANVFAGVAKRLRPFATLPTAFEAQQKNSSILKYFFCFDAFSFDLLDSTFSCLSENIYLLNGYGILFGQQKPTNTMDCYENVLSGSQSYFVNCLKMYPALNSLNSNDILLKLMPLLNPWPDSVSCIWVKDEEAIKFFTAAFILLEQSAILLRLNHTIDFNVSVTVTHIQNEYRQQHFPLWRVEHIPQLDKKVTEFEFLLKKSEQNKPPQNIANISLTAAAWSQFPDFKNPIKGFENIYDSIIKKPQKTFFDLYKNETNFFYKSLHDQFHNNETIDGLLFGEISLESSNESSLTLEEKIKAYDCIDIILLDLSGFLKDAENILKKIKSLTQKNIAVQINPSDFNYNICNILKNFNITNIVFDINYECTKKIIENNGIDFRIFYRTKNTNFILKSNNIIFDIQRPIEVRLALKNKFNVLLDKSIFKKNTLSSIKSYLLACKTQALIFKVCGATSVHDIVEGLTSGADFVGINTIPTSPYYVDPNALKHMIRTIESVEENIVILTSHKTPAESICQLNSIKCYEQPYGLQQLHGTALIAPLYQNIPLNAVAMIMDCNVPLSSNKYSTYWDSNNSAYPLFLSGGLHILNVKNRIYQAEKNNLNIAGIDVNSGIHKNTNSVKKFDSKLIQRFAKQLLPTIVNSSTP